MKIVIWILILLNAILFSSCNFSGTPANLKVIPEEVNVVSALDIHSIVKKGKLSEIEGLNMFKALKREIRNESRSLARLLDDVIDEPKITGIDFKKGLLGFFVDEGEGEQFMCFSVVIANKKKFASFLDDTFDDLDIDADFEDEDTYEYVLLEEDLGIGWDNKKMVMVAAVDPRSSDYIEDEIDDLFSLDGDEQITNNEAFNAFWSAKKDISTWVSMEVFETSYEFKEFSELVDFDLFDNDISYHVNFEKDQVKFFTQVAANEDIQEFMQENEFWNQKFNTELLRFLPQDYVGLMSIAINPRAIYELLSDQSEFDEMDEDFEREFGYNMKEFFETIEGSALFSVFDYDERDYIPYYWSRPSAPRKEIVPIFGIVLSINDNKLIKQTIENANSDSLIYPEKRKEYYELFFSGGTPIYVAHNGSVCLVTNDRNAAKEFKGGGFSKNLGDSNVEKEIASSPMFGVMNLDVNSFPKKMEVEVKSGLGRGGNKILKDWNDMAETFHVKVVDNYSGEFVFKLQKGDENSIARIITMIDDNFRYLMEL